jgi:hypothetical protein
VTVVVGRLRLGGRQLQANHGIDELLEADPIAAPKPRWLPLIAQRRSARRRAANASLQRCSEGAAAVDAAPPAFNEWVQLCADRDGTTATRRFSAADAVRDPSNIPCGGSIPASRARARRASAARGGEVGQMY